MTPAINSARHAGIAFQLHEYQHDNAAPSYGLEAAEKLGVTAEQVFKTLVVSLDGKQLAVGIVPVNSQLGLKQIAKAAGAKKAVMAAPEIVERTTGYVLGGVSPLGQKKRQRRVRHRQRSARGQNSELKVVTNTTQQTCPRWAGKSVNAG